MKISDLFIGKPGGLTTAEALACGLPMVIVSPIPGQEERNSDHLLEDGVAVKCNELTTIPYKIDTLLGDPLRLEQMRRRAFAMSRPEGPRRLSRPWWQMRCPLLQCRMTRRKRSRSLQARNGTIKRGKQ